MDLAVSIAVLAVLLAAASGAGAVLAWRSADPLTLRRLMAEVSQIRDVDLVRVTAQAEALLERADLRFEEAERKRKTVDAKRQRAENGNGGDAGLTLEQVLANPNVPDSERRALLERHIRGR